MMPFLASRRRQPGVVATIPIDPATRSPTVLYDVSDIATLYQSGTRAAPGTSVTADGDPVGLVLDKSGNNYDLAQATASSRPIYKIDGSGKPYLLFDGVDDYLKVAAGSYVQPWDRLSAIQQVTWVANHFIFYSGTSTSTGMLRQDVVSPKISLGDTATFTADNSNLAVGSNGVVAERHNGASSTISVNNGAQTTGNPGTTTAIGQCVGATYSGTLPVTMRLYAMTAKIGGFADADIAGLCAWLGAKAGLAL